MQWTKNNLEWVISPAIEKYVPESAGLKRVFYRVDKFLNGEEKVVLESQPTASRLMVLYSDFFGDTQEDMHRHLWRLFSLLDVLRRNSTAQIFLFLPLFPYSRQERAMGLENISMQMIIRILEMFSIAGCFTYSLHNPTSLSFAREMIFKSFSLESLFQASMQKIQDSVSSVGFVSLDMGGLALAKQYSQIFQVDYTCLYKTRNYQKTNTIEQMQMLGEPSFEYAILVDDMVDSAGSLAAALAHLEEAGIKQAHVFAPFLFLSGSAKERLQPFVDRGFLAQVVGTNAIVRSEAFYETYSWVKEIDLYAHTIALAEKMLLEY